MSNHKTDLQKNFRTLISTQFINEIKRLSVHRSNKTGTSVAGTYRSHFKGSGVEFEDLREYIPGDDIRQISWHTTAKTNKPQIKRYKEERELSIVIAVDSSMSLHTGTTLYLKKEIAIKLVAAIGIIALGNQDKVAMLNFGLNAQQELIKFYQSTKHKHIFWSNLLEVYSSTCKEYDKLTNNHRRDYNTQSGNIKQDYAKSLGTKAQKTTDLKSSLFFLQRNIKGKSIIFLISDFLVEDFANELKILKEKHEIIAITISDPSDYELPDINSSICLQHPETQQQYIIDCSNKKLREQYKILAAEKDLARKHFFRTQQIPLINVATNDSLVFKLIEIFQ